MFSGASSIIGKEVDTAFFIILGICVAMLFLITFLARRAAIRAQVADVSRAHQAGLNIAVRANRSATVVATHGFSRRFFAFSQSFIAVNQQLAACDIDKHRF